MAPIENAVSDEDWHCDNEISDTEVLWRVIHPEWIRKHPLLPGSFVASDQAYRQHELSVFIASRTTMERVLRRWPGDSLASFTAGYVRDELGLIVVRDPKDTDPDPAHRLVGRTDHNRISSSTAHKIALKAEWVVFNHT